MVRQLVSTLLNAATRDYIIPILTEMLVSWQTEAYCSKHHGLEVRLLWWFLNYYLRNTCLPLIITFTTATRSCVIHYSYYSITYSEIVTLDTPTNSWFKSLGILIIYVHFVKNNIRCLTTLYSSVVMLISLLLKGTAFIISQLQTTITRVLIDIFQPNF